MKAMTAQEYVKSILPNAYAYESEYGGGWCIDADISPVKQDGTKGKPVPHLVSGYYRADLAWRRAARVLGWEGGK